MQAVATVYAKSLRHALQEGGGTLSWTPRELDAIVSIIIGIRQYLGSRFAQDDGVLPDRIIATWTDLVAHGLYPA